MQPKWPKRIEPTTDDGDIGSDAPADALGCLPPALRRAFGFAGDDEGWFAVLGERVRPAGLSRIGAFELVAEAGRGGQGLVYRARQLRPNREVALKRLAAGIFATPSMRARFEREIESAAALDHPNIVKVYGVEEIDGQLIVALQWIEGKPLDRWARPAGEEPRPVAHVVEVFRILCDAIRHAHERGVIHRDLKPSNVLVDAAGQPRVLDFGLARRTDDSADPRLTQPGAFMGTPVFAPPEQLRGDFAQVGARSDVYAIGAMLHQCLTGFTPVEPHLTPNEMLRQIERFGPRPPQQLNPLLDREICSVVLKALQSEPENRYASVEALGCDLGRYCRGEPIRAQSPGVFYRLRKFAWRNRSGLIVATGVAAILAGTIAIASVYQSKAIEADRRSAQVRQEKELLDDNAMLDADFEAAQKLAKEGKLAEADALFRRVYDQRRTLVGDEHWSIVPVAQRIGERLLESLQLDAAEPYLAQALRVSKREQGGDSPARIAAELSVASLRLFQGRYEEAANHAIQVVETSERSLEKNSLQKLNGLGVLYTARLAQGRWLDAAIVADQRTRDSAEKYGSAHRYTTHWMYWSAAAHRLAGDEATVLKKIQPALETLEAMAAKRLSQQPPAGDRIFVYRDVGAALTIAGRCADAEPHLRRAVGMCRRTTDVRQVAGNGSMNGALGECLFRMGKTVEAERLLLDAACSIQWAEYLHWKFYYAYLLIELYDATGRLQAAEYWRDCVVRRPPIEWRAPEATTLAEQPDQAARMVTQPAEVNEEH